MLDTGRRLRQMAAALSIEDLTSELGMSASSFHLHFKTVTSMSPLQFQRLLRLQEARRLLISEDLDIEDEDGVRDNADE